MITQLFQFFDSISNNNQMIAGAISLWFMGSITFIARYLPQLLAKIFVKHLTTSLMLTSHNQSFYTITKYLQSQEYTKKFRRLKLRNGKYGNEKTTITSVGQGWHWIWFAHRPIWIHVEELQTENEYDKERITLVILGRNNKFFERFLDAIYPDNLDNLIEVNIESKRGWEFSSYQPKRKLESVIIKKDKLSLLTNRIDKFLSSEDWYRKHGIPYTLGILLYGPPGTGKTSLIRAIASDTNRKLYIVSAASLTRNPSILLSVPKESIIVIEDIDSCINALSRSSKDKSKNNSSEEDDTLSSLLGAYSNISDLLNALDGICSSHGRILFMTTNHPEKLDAAILRPGRCDLKIELGYMNISTFMAYMSHHFPDEDWSFLSERELNTSNLTCAMLQNEILQQKKPCEIVQKYTQERK